MSIYLDHPDHPGLKVEITVNDQAPPKFEDEDEPQNSKVITKYIEAQSATEFKVDF